MSQCEVPPHIPPGILDRLERGEWIAVSDLELAFEIFEIAKCLGKKAKIELIDL
ncbi:MAG: hypothetical protein ACPL3C_01260 [Pyrobaculum sp.]